MVINGETPWRRMAAACAAVIAMGLMLQSLESHNPNNFGGLFGYLAICFIGGFIGGSIWSVPAVIASIYAASAVQYGINLPQPDGQGFIVFILFFAFMAISAAIVACGVYVSTQVVARR
jgi:hypothetical protein